MLANPVAFDFDEKGRLFVSETYRYRTSVLDIRDYMGMLELDLACAHHRRSRRPASTRCSARRPRTSPSRAKWCAWSKTPTATASPTSARVFADGFNTELDGIASGVLARHGKVWFTNIPSLWLLEEGADGKVKKDELLRGFGVRYNFTGHDFHGLAHGPRRQDLLLDRRSRHAREGQGRPGRSTIRMKARCSAPIPTAPELEMVAHGLRNPQELVFDEHGNLFTGDNDSDQGDMERLVYLVEGGDSGWRVGYQHAPLGKGGPWMREGLWKPRVRRAPRLSTAAHLQHRGRPVGPHLLPGHRPRSRSTPGISSSRTSRAASRAAASRPTRSSRTARRSRPPAASSSWAACCRRTSRFGPDGKLYILDWVDGWPKSQQGPRLRHLAGEAGSGAGRRSAPISPNYSRMDSRSAATQELAALLSHPGPARAARSAARAGVARRDEREACSPRSPTTSPRRRWRACTPCGA